MSDSHDTFMKRAESGDFWSVEWYRFLKLERRGFWVIFSLAFALSLLGMLWEWNDLFNGIVLVCIFTSIGIFSAGARFLLTGIHAYSDWQRLINDKKPESVEPSVIEKVKSNNSNRHQIRIHKEHIIKLLRNQIALQMCLYTILYRFNGISDNRTEDVVYSWLESIYFSIVTWTTLGYGDYSPVNWLKLVAASQALTGYLVMAIIIGLVIKDYRED